MPAERYGFAEREWQLLAELVRQILVERVVSDTPVIAYSELTQEAVRRLRNRPELLTKTREILTPEFLRAWRDARGDFDRILPILPRSRNAVSDRCTQARRSAAGEGFF